MRYYYNEEMKRPEWKVKAKEIKERDGRCMKCGSVENLEVHHTYYCYDVLPWEYIDASLITLCRTCHQNISDGYEIQEFKWVMPYGDYSGKTMKWIKDNKPNELKWRIDGWDFDKYTKLDLYNAMWGTYYHNDFLYLLEPPKYFDELVELLATDRPHETWKYFTYIITHHFNYMRESYKGIFPDNYESCDYLRKFDLFYPNGLREEPKVPVNSELGRMGVKFLTDVIKFPEVIIKKKLLMNEPGYKF